MPRQVIVLEQNTTEPTRILFSAAFWLNVPANRQFYYTNASFQSMVKDGSVSAPETTALQNGSVIEVVVQCGFATGTSIANIQSALQVEWNQLQSDLNNGAGQFAPYGLIRYGSFWDGSSWTMTNHT